MGCQPISIYYVLPTQIITFIHITNRIIFIVTLLDNVYHILHIYIYHRYIISYIISLYSPWILSSPPHKQVCKRRHSQPGEPWIQLCQMYKLDILVKVLTLFSITHLLLIVAEIVGGGDPLQRRKRLLRPLLRPGWRFWKKWDYWTTIISFTSAVFVSKMLLPLTSLCNTWLSWEMTTNFMFNHTRN